MAVLIGLLGICGAVVIHMIASELYHQTPRLAVAILGHAVLFLPEAEQSRYLEEWTAHLEQQDGALARLVHAVQCWLAARSLGEVLAARPTAAEEREVITLSSAATVEFLKAVLPRIQASHDPVAVMDAAKEEIANGLLAAPDPDDMRRIGYAILRVVRRRRAKRAQ